LKEYSKSYREWLQGASNLKLETSLLDAPVTKYCGASVMVLADPPGVPATIEFGFVYRSGSWNLAQIGEMP
jgi:hypothetical protein